MRSRTPLFYLSTLLLTGLGIFAVLHLGAELPGTKEEAGGAGGATGGAADTLAHFFLQLLVIMIMARAVGGLFRRIGQPSVVGEMAAGILLGPSLFGWLAPGAFAFVFPETSLGSIKLLSQIGVCFFMFAVGMELNLQELRRRARAAVVVSHASIVFPYLLGVVLAYFLYTDFAAAGSSFTAFALFMGISMSITAFPVLARILQERNLTRTPLGCMAITCAAVDDVTAWCLLAFVVAIVGASDLAGVISNLGLVVLFVAVMVLGVRRVLPRWLGAGELEREEPTQGALTLVVGVVIAAALCTEMIGIHALFGAFLAGAIMPDANGFRRKLGIRVEHLSSVLLLPLFFAFTGLRTQVGLLADASGWLLCLLVIGVATLGKLGASAAAARFTGMNWRDSLQIGALMNTRGLMELIALNIGYDLGVLSPRIFTVLVLMALATTTLTGPLLTLFAPRRREVKPARPSLAPTV